MFVIYKILILLPHFQVKMKTLRRFFHVYFVVLGIPGLYTSTSQKYVALVTVLNFT